MMKVNTLSIRLMIGALLIATALISILNISGFVSSPDFHHSTVSSLDDKKTSVMRLAAASTATSTALSLLPGDTASPVAQEIAELGTYFIIILCAIILEKMLLAVVGTVAFSYVIPFACALGIGFLFTNRISLRNLAIKLAIFALVLFMAIPISMQISDLVTDMYDYSIDKVIAATEENAELIEETERSLAAEEKNWLEKMGDSISDFTAAIGSKVAESIKRAEGSLSAFLEAVAILIVTSCIIPLVVLLMFASVIKILFGFDMQPKRVMTALRIAPIMPRPRRRK